MLSVPEIPCNEVRTKEVTVTSLALQGFFEKLHVDPNVVKIEHWPSGRGAFQVVVHYAVMNLALQLASISAGIEKSAEELNHRTHRLNSVS
jgi:hypothetical protein